MKPKVHLITLGARDFPKMLAFYRDGLGWPTKAAEGDGIAFFKLSGLVFALCNLDELEKDSGQTLNAEPPAHITLSQNLSSEEEVVRAIREVEKAGGRIVKQPQKADWGGFRGYFADPEGNLWEIAYNPFFSFDDQGDLVV